MFDTALKVLAALGFLAGGVGLVWGYVNENVVEMVFWGVVALLNQATVYHWKDVK